MNDLEKYFYENDQRDLDKWNNYFDIYDKHFSKFRNKKITILEIGVFKGGSLQMWKNYFGKDATIIGIDIYPKCKELEEDQIHVEIGSQEDPEFLAKIKQKYPKFDIVLDDGGHSMNQQIVSFTELFEHVADGGVYMTEDTHTSYWSEYGGGLGNKNNFTEYTKHYIDKLNAWYVRDNGLPIDSFTRNIKAIHYYLSIIVFDKGAVEEPKRLCSEAIAKESKNDSWHIPFYEAKRESPQITPSQIQTSLEKKVISLTKINDDLRLACKQLEPFQIKYHSVQQEYLKILNSSSWRITGPIRKLFSYFKNSHVAHNSTVEAEKDESAKHFSRDHMHIISSLFYAKKQEGKQVRINMILPSCKTEHMSGGPKTLIDFTESIMKQFPDYLFRIIPNDILFDGDITEAPCCLRDFKLTPLCEEGNEIERLINNEIIINAKCKEAGLLGVAENDIFIASMWTTHYIAKELQAFQGKTFGKAHKLIYMIQDYESSALHAWSEHFVMAENTYKDAKDTIAVFNTEFLAEYIKKSGFEFDNSFTFNPLANITEVNLDKDIKKKKELLIYGRPCAQRNCFGLIMEALLKITKNHEDIATNWKFISAGEPHPNYKLSNGAILECRGVLPIEKYKEQLMTASVGCCLVVSPHPGYVPLEMARAGLLTVSNSFVNKNIDALHPNIRSPKRLCVNDLVECLVNSIRKFESNEEIGVVKALEEASNPMRQGHNDIFYFIKDLMSIYKFKKR